MELFATFVSHSDVTKHLTNETELVIRSRICMAKDLYTTAAKCLVSTDLSLRVNDVMITHAQRDTTWQLLEADFEGT